MLDYVKSVALVRMEAKALQDRLKDMKMKGEDRNPKHQSQEYRQLYNMTGKG